MKKLVLLVSALLLLALGVSAQEKRSFKRFGNNIQIGSGLFLESGYRVNAKNPGVVIRLSYGLDYRFNEKWSIMPGVGYRLQSGDIQIYEGSDCDYLDLADFSIAVRYHLETDADRIVLGLGPALSYLVTPDTYYIDYDPKYPLNGKEKFHRFDVGIQPSVSVLLGKHLQCGLEANIGLLNMRRQYPEYDRTGSTHLHYIALMCGVHF